MILPSPISGGKVTTFYWKSKVYWQKKRYNLKWGKMELFISTMGLVLIIEGLPYFMDPNGMKSMAGYLQTVNSKNLRIGGFVLMAAGLAILYVFHSS